MQAYIEKVKCRRLSNFESHIKWSRKAEGRLALPLYVRFAVQKITIFKQCIVWWKVPEWKLSRLGMDLGENCSVLEKTVVGIIMRIVRVGIFRVGKCRGGNFRRVVEVPVGIVLQ